MQIKSTKTLAQFQNVLTAGNTGVFDSNLSKITLNKTTANTENCYTQYKLNAVNPSDVYEIAILARKISGANAVFSVLEHGGVNPSAVNSYNYVDIYSEDLRWYRIKTTVKTHNAHTNLSPINLSILCGFNNLTTGAGQVEILDFKINQVESSNIFPRMAFGGCLKLVGGALQIESSVYAFSMNNLSIQDNSIVLTDAPRIAEDSYQTSPLILTHEITNYGLLLKQVSYDTFGGVIFFKIYDRDNNEVDLSALSATFNLIALY